MSGWSSLNEQGPDVHDWHEARTFSRSRKPASVRAATDAPHSSA